MIHLPSKKADINNESLVLMISYGDCDYLYLGDLPGRSQNELNIEFTGKLDVVKVSHHGSKDGYSSELLRLATPLYAVISVGQGNQYNHPAPSTLKAYGGSTILRTDEKKDIKMYCDGESVFLD